MKKATFQGGTHPFDGKLLSKDKPIKKYFPKGDMVYPLSQHIGVPAKPLVKKGDPVLAGQKIAEAGGFVSAHIFSSVSGTVKAVEPRMTASGVKVNSIVIENDGLYTQAEGVGVPRDYTRMSNQEIIAAVQEAGIVGMGGAGFPNHVKLSPKNPEEITHVIVNGAECEPYLTSDYRRMLEEPEKIIGGLKIVLQLFPGAVGVIGIEDNKPEAIAKMTEMTASEANITVCPLKTKYPQGAERNLIYAITGKALNSTMLPAAVGCIVDNVDTYHAIYEAVCESTPLMSRIVTITGDAVADPVNFEVLLGTDFSELVEAAGGFVSEPEKVIAGGPMMGMAISTLQVPVVKTSSALLCVQKDAVAASEETACIHCGRCVDVCPEKLIPTLLKKHAEKLDVAGFEKAYGMECCECGSCTYICPARRQLTQSFKVMRRMVAEKRRKGQQ